MVAGGGAQRRGPRLFRKRPKPTGPHELHGNPPVLSPHANGPQHPTKTVPGGFGAGLAVGSTGRSLQKAEHG